MGEGLLYDTGFVRNNGMININLEFIDVWKTIFFKLNRETLLKPYTKFLNSLIYTKDIPFKFELFKTGDRYWYESDDPDFVFTKGTVT